MGDDGGGAMDITAGAFAMVRGGDSDEEDYNSDNEHNADHVAGTTKAGGATRNPLAKGSAPPLSPNSLLEQRLMSFTSRRNVMDGGE
jgi:hypothetical protein